MEEPKSSTIGAEARGKVVKNDEKEEKEEDDEEECAICSTDIIDEFSRPEPCYHRFHYLCIKTWAGIKLTCPMCRMLFKRIFTYTMEDRANPKLKSTEVFEAPKSDVLAMLEYFAVNPYEHTVCKICGGGDNEEQILLCDDCDEGYHMYCLTPRLEEIPVRNWYCQDCTNRNRPRRSARGSTNHVVATRTADSNRIASFVQQTLGICEDSNDSDTSDGEEESEFSELDRAVLDAITPGPSSGARVERKRKATKKKDKPKTKKRRRVKRRPRRSRSKRLARNVRDEREKNAPYSPSQQMFSPSPSSATRPLSITGGGIENAPYFDDKSVSVPSPPSPVSDEADKADLLGQIMGEQEKLLADGKLFKIENGKFEPTKEFQKYQTELHKKFDKETKKKLGMPVDEEKAQPSWEKPTSSRQKSVELTLDDAEIDPEVREQIELLAMEDKEEADRQLMEAQKKALADQKREKMEKKLAEEREKQYREQERKKLQHDAEQSVRQQEKVRKERERRDRKDMERKKREESKKKEKERETAKIEEEQNRKVEEKKREQDKQRSRDRSPKHREKKDDRQKSRDERKREERHREHKDDREKKEKRDRRERDQKEANNPGTSASSAAAVNPTPALLGALASQAPPDYGSIYGNPFQVPSLSLLSIPEQQILLAQAQSLAALGLPLQMPLPLTTTAGFLPAQIGVLQPVATAPAIEERTEKEESGDSHSKGHKDQATKIIESYSIRTVKEYFAQKKINRQQYSDVLKKLVGEYRKSKSVEQLKSKEMKKEIKDRTMALLKMAMKKSG